MIRGLLEENKHDKRYVEIVKAMSKLQYARLTKLPSPRFIKSHLPFSLLPPSLLDTCKVVFVTRDPRDVAVSFYHHNRLLKNHGFIGDFKTYWNYFIQGLGMYSYVLVCLYAFRFRILYLWFYFITDLANTIRRIYLFLAWLCWLAW